MKKNLRNVLKVVVGLMLLFAIGYFVFTATRI